MQPDGETTVRFGTLSDTGAIVDARAALQRAQEMVASK